MTCGIYKLIFNGTDKVYIGQSKNIERRFNEHLNKLINKNHSFKLINAYLTFGTPTYKVVEECSQDKLNELETNYIDKYNSIYNGFNTSNIVNGHNILYGETNPNSIYTNEQIELVFSLLSYSDSSYTDISEYTGVSRYVIRIINNGQAHLWLQDKYPEDYIKMRTNSCIRANVKTKDQISVIVEIFKTLVNNSTILYDEIAKIFNVTENVVSLIANGYSNKWLKNAYPAKYQTMIDNIHSRRKSSIIKHSKYKEPITIISPDKIEYSIITLSSFSREHKLELSSISRLVNNKIRAYKGWTLKVN